MICKNLAANINISSNDDDVDDKNKFWSHIEPLNTTVTFMYSMWSIHSAKNT